MLNLTSATNFVNRIANSFSQASKEDGSIMQDTTGTLDTNTYEDVQGLPMMTEPVHVAGFWSTLGFNIRNTVNFILSMKWAEIILMWLIRSTGTISGLALIIATIYLTIDISPAHSLLLSFMSELQAANYLKVCLIAYSVLPELLIFSSGPTAYEHFLDWLRERENRAALLWAVLYAIITIVFAAMTIQIIVQMAINLVDPNASNQTMSLPVILVRVITSWFYATVTGLYANVGIRQEKARKASKDKVIAGLQSQLNAVAAQLKETQSRYNALNTQVSTEVANKLQVYSSECKKWLDTPDMRSVSIKEISFYTGHTEDTIIQALAEKKLVQVGRVTPGTQPRVKVSSLKPWLLNNHPIGSTPARLHVVTN